MTTLSNPEKTYLSHDITFFLDDDHFKDFFQQGSGMLKALRQDGEASGAIPVSSDSIDISLSWNGDIWTSPDFCTHVTRSMAAFISPNAIVQTDRLHVSILSAFLKKKVFLFQNSYFKNRAVFEHSIMSRFQNVQFINTLPVCDVIPSEPAGRDEEVLQAKASLPMLNVERLSDSRAEFSDAAAQTIKLIEGDAVENDNTLMIYKKEEQYLVLLNEIKQEFFDILTPIVTESENVRDEIKLLNDKINKIIKLHSRRRTRLLCFVARIVRRK